MIKAITIIVIIMTYIAIVSFLCIFTDVSDYNDDFDDGTIFCILLWPIIFVIYVCIYLPMKFAKWLTK